MSKWTSINTNNNNVSNHTFLTRSKLRCDLISLHNPKIKCVMCVISWTPVCEDAATLWACRRTERTGPAFEVGWCLWPVPAPLPHLPRRRQEDIQVSVGHSQKGSSRETSIINRLTWSHCNCISSQVTRSTCHIICLFVFSDYQPLLN